MGTDYGDANGREDYDIIFKSYSKMPCYISYLVLNHCKYHNALKRTWNVKRETRKTDL